MNRPVFLDNTVLSNFALVDRVELVLRLWPDRVATTEDVADEYRFAARSGLLPPDAWAALPAIGLSDEELAIARTYSTRLGRGERSCLAVAQMRDGPLASDDADARASALRLGVRVTGTLGILATAVRPELLELEQANALLSTMIAAGYRSPLQRLDTLV